MKWHHTSKWKPVASLPSLPGVNGFMQLTMMRLSILYKALSSLMQTSDSLIGLPTQGVLIVFYKFLMERFNVIKYVHFPKLFCRFSEFPIRTWVAFFFFSRTILSKMIIKIRRETHKNKKLFEKGVVPSKCWIPLILIQKQTTNHWTEKIVCAHR